MGDHNHDHEECPQVPAVVARLDVRTPRLSILVDAGVDGEALSLRNVLVRAVSIYLRMQKFWKKMCQFQAFSCDSSKMATSLTQFALFWPLLFLLYFDD